MKLVQKIFLKGGSEFELTDDMIIVSRKRLLREEKATVMLSILNPEPVVNNDLLEFHSRVKCDPLLTLLIDKPNAREFKTFVNELKIRARQAYNSFAGLKSGTMPEGLEANVYDEPPEFDTPGAVRKKSKPVDVDKIQAAIRMLEQYLDTDDIRPLLSALRDLQNNPHNENCYNQLITAFDAMGPHQGAVLTYAPYVGLLLSDESLSSQS